MAALCSCDWSGTAFLKSGGASVWFGNLCGTFCRISDRNLKASDVVYRPRGVYFCARLRPALDSAWLLSTLHPHPRPSLDPGRPPWPPSIAHAIRSARNPRSADSRRTIRQACMHRTESTSEFCAGRGGSRYIGAVRSVRGCRCTRLAVSHSTEYGSQRVSAPKGRRGEYVL